MNRRNILLGVVSLWLGISVGYLLFVYKPSQTISKLVPLPNNEIIGFLPYWLLPETKNKDYSPYITTLTYFDLTLDNNGGVQKLLNPQEEEPGWHALNSGSLDQYLSQVKAKGVRLSLLVFSGDPDIIEQMVRTPQKSADNLIGDVAPLMKKYGFSDLNLDIEDIRRASPSASQNFTKFVRAVKNSMTDKKLGTLTIDISPDDLIHKKLINAREVGSIADKVVIMGYDYHYIGSYVTGAVAPLAGAGIDAEYDVETAITKARDALPAKKIILGAPLYGYSWETLTQNPKSAVIPGTGLTMSTFRLEQLLSACASCSAKLDAEAEEAYLVYKDQETGTYHQVFFPSERSMEAKVEFARQMHLGGMAVWALGYEGSTVLNPLRAYKAKTIYLF